MSDQAKATMMLCEGLESAEQAKVERLDRPISEKFFHAHLVVRLCQPSGSGNHRVLNFNGPSGTVGSIRAADFMSAPDQDAVAMIKLSGS